MSLLFIHLFSTICLKNCFFSMNSNSFHGDENLLEVENILEVLCELCPNIPRLSSDEHNMNQSIIVHHVKFDGPIYPNLVKEFWNHASVKFDGTSVSSNVFGNPITITPATIAATIDYALTGTTV